MHSSRTERKHAQVRPIRRRNVSQEVVERLASEIGQGRLKPGERLRSERDLSETYAVSRSSVREAIKTLESRGLVEGRQGKGTFVRTLGLETLIQLPAAPMLVNETAVRQLFEVRDLLEPGIARAAATRARPGDIAAIRRMLERHEERAEQGKFTSDDDARFHLRLARLTDNPVLIRLLEAVMSLLAVVREPALRAAAEAGMRVKLSPHWDILQAVEARDPDAAAVRMSQHLANARETAIRVIRQQEAVVSPQREEAALVAL
jgi:GntR family transcriptional regulator, transcriptional repressor for pyruvate dehydrogenase complex